MNESPPESSELQRLVAYPEDGPDQKDDKIAELEQQVQALENKVGEERFVWILLSVVLFDCLMFSRFDTWAAPIVIGVLQLIGLVILADRCKVDAVLPIIDRLTGAVSNFKSNGEQ